MWKSSMSRTIISLYFFMPGMIGEFYIKSHRIVQVVGSGCVSGPANIEKGWIILHGAIKSLIDERLRQTQSSITGECSHRFEARYPADWIDSKSAKGGERTIGGNGDQVQVLLIERTARYTLIGFRIKPFAMAEYTSYRARQLIIIGSPPNGPYLKAFGTIAIWNGQVRGP